MSNTELTLALDTPIEDLVPAMISWNNKELLTAVKEQLSKYDGVAYTKEQVAEAKKDLATLNKFAKALTDERIRIKDVYMAPYNRFKGEVDEVVEAVTKHADAIKTQINSFEEADKQKKQASLRAYFDEVIGGFKDFISFEKIMQAKWLNASVKENAVRKEIDAVVEDAHNAMAAIDALGLDDDTEVKMFYFHTLDITAALLRAREQQADRAKVAALKEKVDLQSTVPETVNHTIAAPAEAPPSDLMTIDFRVHATRAQAIALRNFLIEQHIKYSKL